MDSGQSKKTRGAYTAGGLGALVVWSCTVALSTSMAESLGKVTGAALAMLLGGLVSMLIGWIRGTRPWDLLKLDRRYLWGCGGFFVAYMVCFYSGIGFSPDKQTAMVVGLLNYLWPVLLVAFSVPILKQPARMPLLVFGCLVTFAGTAVARLGCTSGILEFTWRSTMPLILGAAAGVLWPLYSNFARRWGPPTGSGAVSLFLLISGAGMALIRLILPEKTVFTAQALGEMLFLSLIAIALCYVLWEEAMRKGNNRILGIASYFVPLASMTLASCYLHVQPGTAFFVGTGLVVAGALLSKLSLKKDEKTTA